MFKTAGLRRAVGAALVTAATGTGAIAIATMGSAPVARAQDTDFSDADRNGDGRVDRDEYEKRMVEVFYLADANKDGVLEIEEVEVAERQVFERADTDHNGKVTLREFLVVRMADFDAADTNHDGVLSKGEVEAWPGSR
jgi:Ca2+-binding EF-hand superfamily protein